MTDPTPIVELGVAEAHAILARLDPIGLPPLDAIENEDWGRDFVLSRLVALPPATLAELGLARDAGWDADAGASGP